MPDHSHVPTSAGGVLRISIPAIAANYRLIKDHVAPAECAAVLKADAYGLGAEHVAPALYREGCRTFFVALLSEAKALRLLLAPDARIFVLNGLLPGSAAAFTAAGIVPVLNSYEQYSEWSSHAAATGQRLPAILQVDTGMSRMGMSPDELRAALANANLDERLDIQVIMSHLACADDPAHTANAMQRAAFGNATAGLDYSRSLSNSAGCFIGPEFHYDLCRPGAALFGLKVSPASLSLNRAVEVYGRISQIRSIKAGTRVGYGYSFQAERDLRLATVCVGYADGWPRSLSNNGTVWFNDTPLPIVGRVSMDSFVIDVSALTEQEVGPGALVELLGPHQTPEAVGDDAGTIGYEIFTRLGRRFHREYI